MSIESHYEAEKPIHSQRDGISAVRDYTAGGGKYRQPSHTTIEREPLYVADIVVGKYS